MEAGMQGVAGGVLGMFFGTFLALIMDGSAYGGHLFSYLPLMGLLVCAGLCIIAGFFLATLASIYPSWMASRMAPMDAMRIE
jgi:ABC-type antimicrobial peptide transport system permease subunit